MGCSDAGSEAAIDHGDEDCDNDDKTLGDADKEGKLDDDDDDKDGDERKGEMVGGDDGPTRIVVQ